MRCYAPRAVFALLLAAPLLSACQDSTREQAEKAGRAMIEDAKEAADKVADRTPGARKIGRELKKAGRKAKKALKKEAEVMEKSTKLNGRTLRDDIKDFGAEDKEKDEKN